MSFPRASGILLHPTSLASRGGIGDFGPAAYAFADFLASARQGLWQVLPLGPLGFGNSPYSSTSAFAGNPLLVSLERLADRGWIDRAQIDALPSGVEPVNYASVFQQKMPLLFEAARKFVGSAAPKARARYEEFCRQNQWWLDDFALFAGLRARFKLESWKRWPRELSHRDPVAIKQTHAEMLEQIDLRRVVQFFFFEQWQALRAYCAQHSIRIVGDMAIFVNFDSADVWTHPELFRLNSELDPEVVAGVPPDFFSKDGQRWGNPLYRWDVMKEEGYSWWIDRMRWLTHNFYYIRLDHFRGFSQFW
ncbi:MAG: 4-alpha-glucanotransferase, partial [Terriglobales bacterium]